MILRTGYFLFLAIVASSLQAQAQYSILSDSEFGSGYASLNTEVNYSKNDKNDPLIYFSQWNISAGTSQSKIQDATTKVETSYKTQDFAAGLGWAYSPWNLDLSLLSSKTPETNFTQSGGDLDLTFNHKFIPANEGDFTTRLTAGFGYGSSLIQQEMTVTALTVNKEKNVELEQKKISGFISYMPIDWFKAKITATGYSYNKSKANLQKTYSNLFLNNHTTDLVSTVGGLPESSLALKLLFYVSDSWDLELLASTTRLIVDDSLSKRAHLILSKNWDHWVLGFGVSRNETTETKDYTGLFDLSYDF